jgi:hypothetical protein
MRRHAFIFVAVFALLSSACRDSIAPEVSRSARSASATSCTTLDVNGMLGAAAEAFGAGSPNFNSVRGKIENLYFHLDRANTAQTKFRAHDIVDFTLTKNAESELPGGTSAVQAFANGVYCTAGITLTVDDPANTTLILPTDEPQQVLNYDNDVAISFPGNPVGEPSLVVIRKNKESMLDPWTKLDRYPGFVEIVLENEGNTGLTKLVTITVCAEAPDDVFDDLRLGHGRGTPHPANFVITALPSADDPLETPLDCTPKPGTLRLSQRLLRAATSLLTPKPLYARSTMLLRGGGISGTASEFSPFEPVDTKLRAGGGISGTASEFTRMPSAMLLADGFTSLTCVFGQYPMTVPQGAKLPGGCLPMVTVTTREGTALGDVPVEWAFTKPEGSAGGISRASGNATALSCQESYAATATGTTNNDGNAAACVKLDSAGAYSVTARLGIGGDAPEGVTFFTDDPEVETSEVTLDINVAPVTIAIASANPVTGLPGDRLSPRVRVMLDATTPAAQVQVEWTAFQNSNATVDKPMTLTDNDGYATTGWTISSGYNELRAKVANTEDVAVTFTATGSDGAVTLNSCPVGGSRDPINDPSKPFVFYINNPGSGKSIQEIDLYFGASGKANKPSDYRIALEIRQAGGFLGDLIERIEVPVELRGSASENKLATFKLNKPIFGSSGSASAVGNAIALRLVVVENPDNATVNFNVGPCPLGNCKLPKSCAATEVNFNTVTPSKPLGETYRQSVGITVRGSN